MTPNQELLIATLKTGDMTKLSPDQNTCLMLLMLKILAELPLTDREWRAICIAITITANPSTVKPEVANAMIDYLLPTHANN
jgi:hypothetical protein